MADIKFQTEWLSQIALLAQCGTAEDVVALCGAIERAAEGDFASELSPLVQLVFNPIANSMSEAQAKSERNRANGKRNEAKGERTISETERHGSDMGAKPSDMGAKLSKEKEEREENKEEREEVSPHTPLQEEIGETREEREEREAVAPSLDTSNEVSRYGACSEPENPVSEPAAPHQDPVITIPLNDGSEWPVYPDLISEFSKLYPAVDVMQEMRNIRGWCLSNRDKRKTARGVLRFLNTWLSKEQDRGGRQRASPPEPAKRKLTAAEIFALPAINPFELPGGER